MVDELGPRIICEGEGGRLGKAKKAKAKLDSLKASKDGKGGDSGWNLTLLGDYCDQYEQTVIAGILGL